MKNKKAERCDLLPLDVVADVLDDEVLRSIGAFQRTEDTEALILAIVQFSKDNFGGVPTALLEASKIYAEAPENVCTDKNSFVGAFVSNYLHYLENSRNETMKALILKELLDFLRFEKSKALVPDEESYPDEEPYGDTASPLPVYQPRLPVTPKDKGAFDIYEADINKDANYEKENAGRHPPEGDSLDEDDDF